MEFDGMTGGEPQRIENNYVDGIPVSEPHRMHYLILMLAYFFQQLTNWSFNFLVPSLARSLDLGEAASSQMLATIAFWYFIGMTCGAFITGVLSDCLGRRPMILAAIATYSLSSVASGLASDPVLFIIARALTGFGVFSLMIASHAYIAEITPAESRGKWQCLVAAVGFTAAPVAAFLCDITIPVAPEAWRYIFYFGGIGLVPFCLGYIFLKESPRWLLYKGYRQKAEDALRELTGYAIDLGRAEAAASGSPSFLQGLALFFHKQYRRRTLVLTLAFSTITPGIFILVVWPTKVLEQPFGMDAALNAMAYITCAAPLGCYLASLVTDSLGRKNALLLFLAIVSGASFTIGLVPDIFWLIVSLGVLLTCGQLGTSFVLFSYAPESYPTCIRNTATGLFNGIGRLAMAALQPLLFWLAVNYGKPGVFITAGLLLVLPIPLLLLLGENPSGKSLEELNPPV